MNRIERLCKVIDYCMDKILDRRTPLDSHVGWYNYFTTLLDKEIEKDLNINSDVLQVSVLMKSYIKQHIEQKKYDKQFGWIFVGSNKHETFY